MLRIWTEHGFDVFYLWRWILAVSGGVYTVLKTVQSVGRWLDWLESKDRLSRMRRHYVLIHLLQIRISYFWRELSQIVLLAALLILLIRGHYYL